jgi:hypothetical protein
MSVPHAAGDPGWVAWTNSVDTSVAGKLTEADLSNTASPSRTVLNNAFGGTIRPENYGTVDTTGAVDSSTAVLAAIAAWQSTGGELEWPVGTIRVDSQIVLSNDGSAQPKQRSGKWTGRGATFNGSSTAITPAYGGTILDLRYSGGGSNLAKIDTRGLGALEITGITFTDNGVSSNPFIHTTNTTLLVHHCAFIGNPTKATTTCDQDAFILGGTNGGPTVDGAYQSPFQGYGTVIQDNYFARIQRGVLLQTYANSVVIQNNTFWANCGSNLAGGAAIEFAPTNAQYCVGNTVWGNLIECTGYVYAIKGDHTVGNVFMNHIFDYGPNMLGAYYFGDTGNYNMVMAGQHTDTKPFVVETAASLNTNTAINFHQGQWTTYTQPTKFSTQNQPLRIGNTSGGTVDIGSPADLRQIIFRNVALVAKAAFTNFGTSWEADGAGGAMSMTSGTGGSYFTLNNYGVRFSDHNAGPQRVMIGAGIDGIKMGAAADAIVQRAAAGVVNLGKLAVTNTAAATTPGAVTKKMEVFDATGASLGFVALYGSIT